MKKWSDSPLVKMFIGRDNVWIVAGGATLVALACIVFYFVWMTSATLEGEFLSALAGALVGGIITWIIQFISMRSAQTHREEDRAANNRALGHAIAFKMMKVHSNILKLHQHLDEAFQEAKEKSFHGEAWQVVLPLANFPQYVHFSVEEMSLILSLGDDDLLNSLLSMDSIHNSDIDIMQKFSNMREELTKLMPAQMTGNIGSNYLTKEQLAILRPRMVEVNMLVEKMRPQLKKDYDEASSALAKLEAVLRLKLGFKFRISGQPNA